MSSTAEIVVSREDGALLTLSRPITDGDPRLIRVRTVAEDGRPIDRNLDVHSRSLVDESAGFHSFLFRWLGIPVVTLMNKEGNPVKLYFENLAAMWMIEQHNGWTDVQSLQVYRYKTIDVEAATIEYLLGLDRTLAHRLAEQQRGRREDTLREGAHHIFAELNRTISALVAEPRVAWPSSLADMAKRIADLDPQQFVASLWGRAVDAELASLRSRIEEIQSELNDRAVPGEKDESKALSTRVIELKGRLHSKSEGFERLRSQYREQLSVQRSLELRLQSARDLLRLRSQNVGLPASVECPTCHQRMSAETANLHIHHDDEIQRSIEVLVAERSAIRRAATQLESEINVAEAYIRETRSDLARANQELELMDHAVGRDREADIARLGGLLELRRGIDRLEEVQATCSRLREWIRSWKADYSSYQGEMGQAGLGDEERRVEAYRKGIFAWLRLLRHCEVVDADASEEALSFDAAYFSKVEGRYLRYAGAGSDRARLVLAHVLALHQCSTLNGGHHPGFVLLDEPLQQNADETHRRALVDAFAKAWSQPTGQRIVLTYLTAEETQRLIEAGAPIQTLSGRFIEPAQT
jgi:hypothetical protein